MGMDVYGVNPKIRKQPNSKLLKEVGKLGDDGWYERWDKLSQKDKNKWSDENNKLELDNPGIYFRNNVWWWRPLWDYVYSLCDDFISEERYEGGHSNSGEHFTSKEAEQIADKLFEEIDNGNTEAYAKLYEIKTEDEEYNYPFSVVNVREFAQFCEDSGGFEIC
jgi:hypothetical protein